jgi:hypothetical protein
MSKNFTKTAKKLLENYENTSDVTFLFELHSILSNVLDQVVFEESDSDEDYFSNLESWVTNSTL